MSIKSLKTISNSVLKFSQEILEMPTRAAIWHSNILQEDGDFNLGVGIPEKNYDDIINSLVNKSAFGDLAVDSDIDRSTENIIYKVKESLTFLSVGVASFALIGEQLATGSISQSSAISLIAVGTFSLIASRNIEGMIAKVAEEKKLKFPSVEEINFQVYYGNENIINAANGVSESQVLPKNNVSISDHAKSRFEERNAKKLRMEVVPQNEGSVPTF